MAAKITVDLGLNFIHKVSVFIFFLIKILPCLHEDMSG